MWEGGSEAVQGCGVGSKLCCLVPVHWLSAQLPTRASRAGSAHGTVLLTAL